MYSGTNSNVPKGRDQKITAHLQNCSFTVFMFVVWVMCVAFQTGEDNLCVAAQRNREAEFSSGDFPHSSVCTVQDGTATATKT